MAVGVADAARRLGVSERRVRAMLQAGSLRGEKISGVWVVDLADAAPPRASVRPMSRRSSWLLISAADGAVLQGVSPVERHRLRERARRLAAAEDPLPLLRAWLPNRAERRLLNANVADLPALRADHRIAFGGVSDPRAGLLSGNELEAYAAGEDVSGLIEDYLLVAPRPGSNANVVLHAVEGPGPLPWHRVPLLAVAVDLAERPGAREQSKARELVTEALACLHL